MADIGKRIKNRRKELGITQEELAQKLGYKNKSTIAKIENGTNDIVQSKVVEFAKALDTTVAALMGWDDTEPEQEQHYYLDDDAREMAEWMFTNPEYKVLFDASRKVKKEDIEFVRQMIERMTGGDN
jgi:transcriptional regulator with XRE-family HTH domain